MPAWSRYTCAKKASVKSVERSSVRHRTRGETAGEPLLAGKKCCMPKFVEQLLQVLRRLSRAPLFTTITLITLAVGIGANTVIFSVLEGVLLKPLPYPHPEQLIGVWHTAPGIGMQELNMAPFLYFIYREQSTTLQDVGAYSGDSLSVTGTGEPEHVRGLDVTDGTLPMLGVSPVVGRLFNRKDDTAGSPETVLLSY